jgi:general secretion pathway protein G
MDQIPLDPYGKDYQYVQPGIHNPDSYDLFSAGKDHIPGTVDDTGNWESQ